CAGARAYFNSLRPADSRNFAVAVNPSRRLMKHAILACACAALLALPERLSAVPSDWVSAPQPNFPPSALQKSVEGIVKLRLLISKDGRVVSATVIKSSRDSYLDDAARNSVLKWRMKPGAVKPADMSKG